MSSKSEHDEHTRIIALNLNKIGLEKIALSTAEANLFNKSNLVRQPDNLFFNPKEGIIYNIEYKCSNKHKDKAITQLRDTKYYLSKIFPNWRIINLYIHEDYKIEEL